MQAEGFSTDVASSSVLTTTTFPECLPDMLATGDVAAFTAALIELPHGGMHERRVSSVGDMRLAERLLGGGEQFGVGDNDDGLDWLDGDDPFDMYSSASHESECVNEPGDGDKLQSSAGGNVTTLARSVAPSLPSAGTMAHLPGVMADNALETDAERTQHGTPALRESKRNVVAGACRMPAVASKHVPVRQLSTNVGKVPAAEARPQVAQLSHGGHVRMMPVWMTPTPQYPQGRVVIMPVHFLPAGAPNASAMPVAAQLQRTQLAVVAERQPVAVQAAAAAAGLQGAGSGTDNGGSAGSAHRKRRRTPASDMSGKNAIVSSGIKSNTTVPAAPNAMAPMAVAPGQCRPNMMAPVAPLVPMAVRRPSGNASSGTLPPFVGVYSHATQFLLQVSADASRRIEVNWHDTLPRDRALFTFRNRRSFRPQRGSGTPALWCPRGERGVLASYVSL